MFTLFEIDPERALSVSAKMGIGITELLDTVVKEYPFINKNILYFIIVFLLVFTFAFFLLSIKD